MKPAFTLLFFLFLLYPLHSQEHLEYFLPADVEYDPGIPSPEEFLGYPLGEFHVTHDRLVRYMEIIAERSDRAVLEVYAHSYENRPLVQLIFTSPENQARLESLRLRHLENMEPGSEAVDNPLVVRLGYSIHGNESSAGNSSLLTAYYLAAAKGPWIDRLLDNCIILVDPCLNPDGFTRHSTWANAHHTEVPSPDPASRQFSEVWPGGRTNHYWFDLNRDYLLLTHPESRGRVAEFHRWKPNVVTDHHEMGANSSFFFQPGIPSRNNPMTPEENYRLTREIAGYHQQALDRIGSLYFSEEVFDDFYYGKGSSYPDVNSSVGILYEQAGFRGTWRETDYGLKAFAFAIRNQFTVSLSTLRAALDMKAELLDYQHRFNQEALQLAAKDPVKAWVIGDPFDEGRNSRFLEILLQHQIKVYGLKQDARIGGTPFKKGKAFVIPMQQEQYRLIRAMFETMTEFRDTSFYDVSTWTMQLSFNMAAKTLASSSELARYQGEALTSAPLPQGMVSETDRPYAYLFRWDEYAAPRALYALQEAGLRARVATEPFHYADDESDLRYDRGTILVYLQDQPLQAGEIHELLSGLARETGVDFQAVKTGLTPEGPDLGSGSFAPLEKPSVMMVVGSGIGSQAAGEIWHQFDQRYHIPLTLVDLDQAASTDLDRYNVIILPDGSYRGTGNAFPENLGRWIAGGGELIAFQGAGPWLAGQKLLDLKYKPAPEGKGAPSYSYADRSKLSNLNSIPGAILETRLDLSHPIAYGYHAALLPVFKEGSEVAEPGKGSYANPITYTDSPLLSGFVSDENRERLRGAPFVTIARHGRGRLILFHENIHFRGVWYGTNKLCANAVFFGNLMNP